MADTLDRSDDVPSTFGRIRDAGLIAVVRGDSCASAVAVSGALVEGGVVGIEVTFTTPEAHRALGELRSEYGDRIVLGAGTITTEAHVDQAVAAGASFLVSPGCDLDLVTYMRHTGLAVLPGVHTPTEVMRAQRLDLRVVKLFPGSLGGSTYLKSLRAPFPDVAFVPTGGVSAENVGDWFEAGALAVGVGGGLVPPRLEDRPELIARARELVDAVDAVANQRGAG